MASALVALSLPFGIEDPNEIIRAYAANSLFRAATADELVNEDNPFRRPVRPDDLKWLDYSTPADADSVLLLGGLLGHRMLRNVYDADLLYLPAGGDSTTWADSQSFYSMENRIRGELAGPVLERYLFTFLADERVPLSSPRPDALEEHVRASYDDLRAQPGRAFEVAGRTRNRRDSAVYILLQLTAMLPAAHHAVGRNALGEYDLAHSGLRTLLLDDYRRWVERSSLYSQLLVDSGLIAAPGAYWQFYLTSSLARANHLHFVARGKERVFEFLGAWIYKRIDEAATSTRYASVIHDALGVAPAYFQRIEELTEGGVAQLLNDLVAPLYKKYGQSAVESVYAGFEDARWLAKSWDSDLATQLDWADHIEDYKDRAERIAEKLAVENIEVDLDTFIESAEETSTTHVHDEHRLVIIESGQMHFWNNVGHKIALSEGDKLLIPTSRLHGSVVLSGMCTYHQPIIPDEMFREF
ncbi:MAG: peptide synthetase [Egibacteraceae bacterium]